MGDSLSLNMTIGQDYEQQDGILLGKDILNEIDFTEHFRALVHEQSNQFKQDFFNAWQSGSKWITTVMDSKGNKKNIMTVMNNLQPIATAFAKFIGGNYGELGGEISLLTTFNFGNNTAQETYFVPSENTVYHKRDEMGREKYDNTQKTLENLLSEGQKLVKLDNALKSHLNNFNTQVRARNLLTKEDYQFLRAWSYYNLKGRYKAIEKGNKAQVSLARYFWGGGQWPGYISEAYGAHLAMKHSDFMEDHAEKLRQSSVIAEHGGPGSVDLYQLLKSTKGNTSSQLSGDIVVVDENGNVTFNIQSKASRKGEYQFTITYQQFMRNIDTFIKLYEECVQDDSLIEQSAKQIFQLFKTSAWVPVQKKLEEEIEKQRKQILADFENETKK